ncbi:MAG TPA: glycosyltransferase family 2 protein, partial [Anaerolineales bacterium]|nr:glycosyltransferase family 2 protein [Anaerolineales bacterium]
MKDRPKVTLVVLNWNGLADTSECLDCLGAVTYPNYQTIVVDNGSFGDDARALRERFGDSVRVIASPENLGFAGGCNLAMREALAGDADYVLLLNNDVTVDRRFLDELVRAAEGLPDAAALCP